MNRWSLLLLCLFGLQACSSQAATADTAHPIVNSADEMAERNAIFHKVQAAIAAQDFTGLSAMEEDFRRSHARTPSGLLKLELFHSGVQSYLAEGLQREEGCQYRDAAFVQRWAAATPNNPAPFITDAALQSQQAWCFRGTGIADTVAAEDWPKFGEGISAAARLLDQHRNVASIDPEYYAVLVDVLRAHGMSKAEFHAVVEQATAREPDYHRTYFNAAWYYLPQWGGSYAELDAFARYAANRSRADEKSGLYARIFWSLDECGCRISDKAADWPTLRQSMRDIYDRFPNRWNGQYFADETCRRGDTQEGRRYLRAMHPEATDETSFVALFATCDSRARIEG